MRNVLSSSALSLALICPLMLVAPAAPQKESRGTDGDAPAADSIISGQIYDTDGPVTDARVILQSFEDEKCAKLFLSKKFSEKHARELSACSHELPPVTPDKDGRYRFTNVPAGWYALLVLWNMHEKPDASVAMFQKGEFVITYSEGKDASGRHDAMAQSRPFYFRGAESLVKDFDYRKGKISKMLKQ